MLTLFAALMLQAASPPPDCTDAAHRAYDFFIGDWDVADTASGKTVAHSRIEKILGGCAIRETFDQTVGPGGKATEYHGTSLTALVVRDGQWRQLYADTAGATTTLTGRIVDGAMVFSGSNNGVAKRMTVAPQPSGSVRQTGITSRDGGGTWSSPDYDFTYRRRR